MALGILIGMLAAAIFVIASNQPQARPGNITAEQDLRLTIFNAAKGQIRVMGFILLTISVGGLIGIALS